MTKFVLDSSIALAWFFKDEAAPELFALQDLVRQEGAIVPALWYFEVANVLRQGEKRRRISSEDVDNVHLAVIETLPLRMDPRPPPHIMRQILSLARIHNLTTYDAAYLELAMRHGLPLATKDKDLLAAAERLGIATLP